MAGAAAGVAGEMAAIGQLMARNINESFSSVMAKARRLMKARQCQCRNILILAVLTVMCNKY